MVVCSTLKYCIMFVSCSLVQNTHLSQPPAPLQVLTLYMNGPSVIYNYGFLFTYGIGFGFPLLLGLPDEKKSCGRHEFLNTLAQYDLQVNSYQIITLWLIKTKSGRVCCDTTKKMI